MRAFEHLSRMLIIQTKEYSKLSRWAGNIKHFAKVIVCKCKKFRQKTCCTMYVNHTFTSCARINKTRVCHKWKVYFFLAIGYEIALNFIVSTFRRCNWFIVKVPKLCNKEIRDWNHRVDGVLGFFSSHPNWEPPPPHTQASVFLPLWFRGTQSLAGEGVGESQFESEETDTVPCTDTEGVRGNRGEYMQGNFWELFNFQILYSTESKQLQPKVLAV